MKLEFISITLKGFRSFTAERTLDLCRSPGVMFMRGCNEVEPQLGANGAGKSSVWHALCWCFYGKTPEGLRGNDLKPWAAKTTSTVTVTLRVDGRPYVIARRAAVNGLTINGESVGNDEAAKLLGIPFEVFNQTILLAQAQPLFFDLPAKDKMRLFSEVLRLDRWEERSHKASDKATALQQLEAELAGELRGLRSALDQNREWLKAAQARAAQWDAERRQRVEQDAHALKECEQHLETQQRALEEVELAQGQVFLDAQAEKSLTKKLDEEHKQALITVNSAEAERAFKKKQLANLERDLATLGATDVCPVCAQSIKGTDLALHKRKLRTEIEALAGALSAGLPARMTRALAEASAALERNREQIAALEKREYELQTRLNFLKARVSELRGAVSALKARRNEFEEQINPHRETIQDLKARLRPLEADCAAIEEDLRALRRQLERIKFWVKGFKEVKLFVIDEVLQELQITTNTLLTEMGLHGWEVLFSIEKETKAGTLQRGIHTIIMSPANPQPVKYESWSGGESQRLRIAGALALSQVLLNHAGIETNLEVLDEPTKHLSAEGVADLCDYLSARAKQLGRQCWLVDHTARESSGFAGFVTVVKSKDGSYFSSGL